MTESFEHPSALRLEALAAGDDEPAASAHVATCAACRDHVAALRRAVADFAASPAAVPAWLTATGAPPVHGERPHRLVGDAIEPVGQPSPAGREPHPGRARRAWLSRVALVGGPLLAAALVLLVLRTSPPAAPGDPGAAGAAARTGDASSGVRFKGPREVAVIRERAGQQERVVGAVSVRAGDRLRLEVSLAEPGPLAAGVLDAQGAWVLLLAPSELTAGTHFSERAVRFDEQPTSGRLLVGPPLAVEQARRGEPAEGVSEIPIVYEAMP